jgi:hypothetical protein
MKGATIPLHSDDEGQKKPIPIVRLIVQTVLAISYHYEAYKIYSIGIKCVGPSFKYVGGAIILNINMVMVNPGDSSVVPFRVTAAQ